MRNSNHINVFKNVFTSSLPESLSSIVEAKLVKIEQQLLLLQKKKTKPIIMFPKLISMLVGLFFSCQLIATTLHIGNGLQYASLEAAAPNAQPGDTLLLHQGTYPGGMFIGNLQGTQNAWIHIRNAPDEEVIIEGGTNAIQFSDPAYLHIYGLIIQHQTGNGINTDDGGSYDTPAHHIVFENCIFRDMAVDGNNDLLKLSGLDHFEIRNCQFLNGADGGSGIDMVGCHNGIIEGNYFENMGSNSIQCKGGSEEVRIEGNFFKNGGQRTLNLGGSTGLQFFRPIDAPFEAANLQVYSNIIVGSWAAIAYVGSVNVEVVNNTIYQPENWVIRILQETVDPDRFLECGDNTFRNNIVHLSDNLSTETNIGGGTRWETFTFSNNLWFNVDNPHNWTGPNIPVMDINGMVNADPLLSNPMAEDFSIPPNSPAAGAGLAQSGLTIDFLGNNFANPPSVGAIEANPISGISSSRSKQPFAFTIFPNPAIDHIQLEYDLPYSGEVYLQIIDLYGRVLQSRRQGFQHKGKQIQGMSLNLVPGFYTIRLILNDVYSESRLVLVH